MWGRRAVGRPRLEARTERAALPPDALPYLRGATARACLHPSPSALRLSRHDTNYRFLALLAYCLIIYASLADTAALVAWNITRTRLIVHCVPILDDAIYTNNRLRAGSLHF